MAEIDEKCGLTAARRGLEIAKAAADFSQRRKNTGNTEVFPNRVTIVLMKIGVSLPEDLIAFADEAARRHGTSRSELLARLLEAERIRQQVQQYLDRHGWDIVEDKARWQRYQRRRMTEEYGDDEW